MYIIDFDDTLFDTHAFKRARQEALAAIGVSEDVYRQTYAEARNASDGFFTYSDERHAAVLALYGFDTDAAYSALHSVSQRMTDFLFPDTITFLQTLKTQGKSMVLLSLGDSVFQESKTRASGVHDFFDRSFMVQRTKRDVIAQLHDTHPGEMWFINDKIEETKELHDAYPRMRVILRVSPQFDRAAYEQSGLPFADSLTEILSYVQS